MREENELKKFKKPLDKPLEMWYNEKACEPIERYSEMSREPQSRKTSKNFEKRLDKNPKVWYNKWVAWRSNKNFQKRICILKTEQCEKRKGKKNWNPWSIQRAQKWVICIVLWEVRQDYKTQTVIASDSWAMNQISKSGKTDLEIQLYEEFDPGSGRTLAARLTHASRTEIFWFTEIS